MLGVIALAAAATVSINVADEVGDKLDPVPIPVYYPSTIPSPQERVFTSVRGTDTSYQLNIDLKKGCGGAGACYLAYVDAQQGGKLVGKQRVRLRGGVAGRFARSTCGANCSAPAISFKRKGVAYTIAVRYVQQDAERRVMKRIANSALKAGPR